MSNSCTIFCQSQGNHLSFTACDDLENEFALLCSCSDTPVLNALSCLQNLCSPDEFNDLVASEESRCGAAAVSGITTSSTPAQTVTIIATEPTRITVTVANPPAPTPTSPSGSGIALSSSTTSSTTSKISTTFSTTPLPSLSSPTSPMSSVAAAATDTHSHTSLVAVAIAVPLILTFAIAAALAFLHRRRHRRHFRERTPHPEVQSPSTLVATLSDTTISSRKGGGSAPPRRAPESTTLQSHISTPPETCTQPEDHPGRASARILDLRRHTVLDFPDVRATSFAEIPYTPSFDTTLPNQRDTDTAQPRGDAVADERVMVLPWPLGERLLDLLSNRPAQRPTDGSISGSEPLPPYEEQDARA